MSTGNYRGTDCFSGSTRYRRLKFYLMQHKHVIITVVANYVDRFQIILAGNFSSFL